MSIRCKSSIYQRVGILGERNTAMKEATVANKLASFRQLPYRAAIASLFRQLRSLRASRAFESSTSSLLFRANVTCWIQWRKGRSISLSCFVKSSFDASPCVSFIDLLERRRITQKKRRKNETYVCKTRRINTARHAVSCVEIRMSVSLPAKNDLDNASEILRM